MTAEALTQTGIAIQKLIALVSAAPYFQSGTGTHSATAAANLVFCPEKRNATEYQQEQQSPDAFAVITLPEGSVETEFVAGGGKNYFTLSGMLELQFIRQFEGDDKHEELVKFLNFSEGTWLYLLEHAAVDDNLAITNAPRVSLTESSDQNVSGFAVQKRFHRAVYEISWGPGV